MGKNATRLDHDYLLAEFGVVLPDLAFAYLRVCCDLSELPPTFHLLPFWISLRHSSPSIMATDAPTPRKCLGNDCENDASSLQCPSCQKLRKESFFCSQDCFKRNWVHSKSFAREKTKELLTLDSLSIRSYTSPKVTFSTLSLPRKSFLTQIQLLGTSTLSPHSHIPEAYDLYTLCHRDERSPRRSSALITRKPEYHDRSRSLWGGTRSQYWTRSNRMPCVRSVGLRARS